MTEARLSPLGGNTLTEAGLGASCIGGLALTGHYPAPVTVKSRLQGSPCHRELLTSGSFHQGDHLVEVGEGRRVWTGSLPAATSGMNPSEESGPYPKDGCFVVNRIFL